MERIVDITERRYLSPFVIWGTKTAAQICYRLLQKLGANIVAAGDNNIQLSGQRFHDIPILSAEQIKDSYPNAIIVIGSFFYNVSDSIMSQLEAVNGQFSFCRFEQVELLYETECLERVVNDTERYCHIINNIYRDKNCVWKRKVDKNVLSEYRYMVQSSDISGLKEVVANVYGIKMLYLVADTEKLVWMPSVINELAQYGNIGHMIIVSNKLSSVDRNVLLELAEKVFYAICGEEEADYQSYFEELGLIVEFKKLPKEIFADRSTSEYSELTENRIVDSILRFVGCSEAHRDLDLQISKPVHIVQLFNGLANQMLMYLFGRFVEEESGRIVIFDDTVLNLDMFDEDENIRRIAQWNKSMPMEQVKKMVAQTREKNSFYQFRRAEIAEVFDIPIRLLSDYFEEEIWKAYLNKVKKVFTQKCAQSFPLGQVLLEDGMDIAIVRDALMPDEFLAAKHCFGLDTYIFDKPYGLNSIADYVLHCDKTMYYMGVWADGKAEDWLIHNRSWVREHFAFRLGLDDKNRIYEREIRKTEGIMVHIRRGDFVYGKMSADTGYFRKAIQTVENMKEYRKKRYFVFSDDLEWCQQNETALGIDKVKDRTVYVSGNTGKTSYIDMYLMSLGKIGIPTPGSSFSYVAMLISRTMEKCVDIPEYLYNVRHGIKAAPVFIDLY